MEGLPRFPGGVKNLTARNSSEMLGEQIGMKRVPVRALKLPITSKCTVFRCEAIRDGKRSLKQVFWVETAGFWVNVFGRFGADFFGCP